MSSANAQLHFSGPQHKNRVMLVMHRQPAIWCQICCCELNTPKSLELHNESPKHKKKEQAYAEIMEMKANYEQSISGTQDLEKSLSN